jgi:hypothetical protein
MSKKIKSRRPPQSLSESEATKSNRVPKHDLDKLDALILEIFAAAGPRGLTEYEATVLVCEWIARSNDPELQRLADADPAFCQWCKVRVPRVGETQ